MASSEEFVCMYIICMYMSRLGIQLFRVLRANVCIMCVGVTHRNVAYYWTRKASVYNILTACSATRMQLTERHNNHDKRPTLVECATLHRQAHLNLARRRQYRAWVSLHTSYDVFTCIALRHHLHEAFTTYTYP